MIKRTIEVSHRAMHLSVENDQLVIQPYNETKEAARTIPCEDIGVVLVDHPAVGYTHQALSTLMRHGAVVVICGRDHLPAGLLLPMSSHSEVLWRVNEQIAATAPRKKRIWQQLVIAKVRRQAQNLPEGGATRRFIERLATEVKSGDKTNIEAQAARAYWSAWLEAEGESGLVSSVAAQAGNVQRSAATFRRDPDGVDPINTMLNYGYAVIRAAVGRALVCAGLFPALGVHHHNRSNSFALADDLMEPLRPLVDARVRDLYWEGHGIDQGLDRSTKAALLTLLTQPVRMNEGEETSGPLMVSLHRVTASLLRCLRGEQTKLVLPEWEPDWPCS